MPNCVNVGHTAYLFNPRLRRNGPTQNHLDRGARIPHRFSRSLRRFIFSSERHNPRPADTFDQAVRQSLIRVLFDPFEVGGDQLKLDG